MGEQDAFGAAVADPFDHRGVIGRVRQDDAVRQPARQRAERRPVRHIARSEYERRLLVMEIGELVLQEYVVVVCARDVPRAAGAGAAAIQGFVHGRQHLGVLAHAEIVIRTPDGHIVGLVLMVTRRARKASGLPLKIGEYTVAALPPKTVELVGEESIIVHERLLPLRACPG